MNAAAWFSLQSFNGGTRPARSTQDELSKKLAAGVLQWRREQAELVRQIEEAEELPDDGGLGGFSSTAGRGFAS